MRKVLVFLISFGLVAAVVSAQDVSGPWVSLGKADQVKASAINSSCSYRFKITNSFSPHIIDVSEVHGNTGNGQFFLTANRPVTPLSELEFLDLVGAQVYSQVGAVQVYAYNLMIFGEAPSNTLFVAPWIPANNTALSKIEVQRQCAIALPTATPKPIVTPVATPFR